MLEACLLGLALAMDAFTVTVVNGIKYRNYTNKDVWLSSFSFAFFQGLFPLLGYLIFLPIINYIQDYDHWVVLVILGLIGISMIKESFNHEQLNEALEEYSLKIMLFESVATSIDALSSCVILPSFSISPYLTCLIIFIITFIADLIGHKIGKQIGLKFKDKASILGGLILIALGIKCVLEHLNII